MFYRGICKNQGERVEEKDAAQYALDKCGLAIVERTDDTRDAVGTIIEWFFSGDWIMCADDEERLE